MFKNGSADLSLSKKTSTIEDVFHINVRSGTGTSANVVNGLDLITDDALVWTKDRTVANNHILTDTIRGATKILSSNLTDAEVVNAQTLTSFNADGFTVGTDISVNDGVTPDKYVDYCFKKQPRFFDIVKYTGDGVDSRVINHNLGCEAGMVIIRRLTSTENWPVWHRSVSASGAGNLFLNLDIALAGAKIYDANDTTITLCLADTSHNTLGDEYIAYLYAHDPLGANLDDGLIACGSYVGNGSTNGTEINLGWEPQYIMIKASTAVSDWSIFDTMRGIASGTDDHFVEANTSDAESYYTYIDLLSTGFKPTADHTRVNTNGTTYIYMAIRRPMKEPLTSSEVFAIDTRGSTDPAYISNFVVDMAIERDASIADSNLAWERLRGDNFLQTNTFYLVVSLFN